MQKKYFFKIVTKSSAILFCSTALLFGGGVAATQTNIESLYSSLSLLQQTNPLDIVVSIDVKNANISQFIKELQKRVGNKAFFNMPIDDIVDKTANITIKKNATIKVLLDEVLGSKGLTYSLQDNVFMITKKQVVNIDMLYITVVDEKSQPLIGANIIVDNTEKGAIADEKGNAILKNIIDGSIIEVSMVGYNTTKVVASSKKNNLIVKLELEVLNLNEVVVTGYFDKNKRSFTGNASSYSAEELRSVNPTNLLSALSTLDPSFRMIENNLQGSNPNNIPEFQIRGSSSMPNTSNLKSELVGDPNMPTFILDGFEVNAEKVFDLDPMRIESMTILKDAAATAIYGSRASNGVVIINTKQPETGKIRVNYNLDLSMSAADLTDYNLLNAADKLELEKASGYFDPYGTEYQTELRSQDYNYRLGLVKKGYDTYWLNKPLNSVTIGQKHSLSVEGGESAMRYSLDLTYDNSPGIMRESGRERIGMGVMLQYRFKNITFKNTVTYDNVKSTNSPYGNLSTYASLNPYYPYLDENGKYLKSLEQASGGLNRETTYNPLYNATLNTINESKYSQFINNFGIDWHITSKLILRGNIALRHKKRDGTIFKPADHTDFAKYSDSDFYRKGYYSATTGQETFYDGNVVLSYANTWNGHTFNFNGVWNIQSNVGDIYTVRAEGFNDEKLDYITFAAQNAKDILPTGEDYISRLMGFVANFSYSFNDRYLLDLNGRIDGSSKFGINGRWAPFWSAGAGWNINKEEFAKDWRVINLLKLRASFGITGSQSFNPYQSLISYKYYTSRRYQSNIGAIMMGLGNPELKWQQTKELNFGVDVTLLKNRVSVSANYYRNLSDNLLTDITTPSSLGYTTYTANLGQIANRGYEIEVKATVLKNKNGWLTLTASGVHNKNILKKISNSLSAWNDSQDKEVSNAPKIRYVEGKSINSIWAVESLGINQASGKEIFIDRNGNRSDVWSALDQKVMGCTDPLIYGNLGVLAGWKGFQLSGYFNYQLGSDIYNMTLVQRIENADKRYNTDRRVLSERWQKPGDNSFYKDIKDNSITQSTSRFIERDNYLRLGSLSLSYDFPANLIRPLKMETLRLSFSMNDVFRISSVKMERGIEYPFARSFRTSIRIVF